MKYICQICGYVYDDTAEKVPFEALPNSWRCPLCGAAKSDFKPEAEKDKKDEKDEKIEKAEAVTRHSKEDLRELSPGQLAALCSNLARGCEKQYQSKEAGLFRDLADYFTRVAPPIPDASVERLASDLMRDADAYAGIRQTADAANDRGAVRACVWGEKATRMLSSLVSRYLREGEAMLADTSIWVCSVCGFVWIGDYAPALCPVCKVPDWKFEKIEGRA